MEKGGSSGAASDSQLLKIGLKFGKKIYFEDVGIGVQNKSGGGLSQAADGGGDGGGGGGSGGPQKKGRTGVGVQGGLGQGVVQQPPRCQVEGCGLDLSDAKTYYSRHKVCGVHSKTPKVIVAGLEQRFCQQCSRFHLLPEFDQGKRSCRRRLAGHNERRRKPPPGTLLSTRYGSLSSSIFENDGRSAGFLMDFSAYARGRDPWSNTRASTRLANNLPAAIEKAPPVPWHSNVHNPPFINPNVSPGECFTGVSDSTCALSLLSNQPSGSRNHTLSLEYYVNPDAVADPGAHTIQPICGTDGGTLGPTSWGYNPNEAHLGMGQIPQPDYSGELGLGQLSGRRYDSSPGQIHWSL